METISFLLFVILIAIGLTSLYYQVKMCNYTIHKDDKMRDDLK
jgi:hypothetical protein